MNKTSHYRLTIIVPIYNEEDNIAALEDRLSLYLAQARQATCEVSFEYLFNVSF